MRYCNRKRRCRLFSSSGLARTLLGKNNPGGKLPVTFPLNVGRVPCYYNQLPPGRARNFYNSKGVELFPFGFGLSYTKFNYGNIFVKPVEIGPGQTATVSVDVTNSGKLAGDEVVQLYVRDDFSSLARPLQELRGFKRLTLAPGETNTVTFPVGFDQLKFWKKDRWVVEPGSFTLMIGSSSKDIKFSGKLKWAEDPSMKKQKDN